MMRWAVMSSSFTQQHETLINDWNTKCKSKNCVEIMAFFTAHKQDMLSTDSPWFLQSIIQNDDIETMTTLLQQTDPRKYVNLPKYPIRWACGNSTFDMIRLLVSNGAVFPAKKGSGLIYALLQNGKIKGDEMYLCVEYLLSNLDGELYDGNIISTLSSTRKFDRIKMANLIKSKRATFKKALSNHSNFSCAIGYAVGINTTEFVEYMMENGAVLDDPRFYAEVFLSQPNELIIKWLLKQGLDINGNIKNQTITPLFKCFVDKKYGVIELLLENGADIHKKCVYENKQMSPLEYCKEIYSTKLFKHFANYKMKQNDCTIVLGVDLSKLPDTPFESDWSSNDGRLLDDANTKYSNTKNEICDLETELNRKYRELRELFVKRERMTNKKENIERWNDAKDSWFKLLNQWHKWDVMCFIEYLKRVKYVEKSYDKYYSSYSECQQKIEAYVKQNLKQFSIDNADDKPYFKGIYLKQFDHSSIRSIGITAKDDIDRVYLSIQQLIKTNADDKDHREEEKGNGNAHVAGVDGSEEQKLKDWLTGVVQLPQYINVFIENDITLEIMQDINRDVLKEMGVKSIGNQMRIMKHAQTLKEGNEGAVANESTMLM
eukprot:948864_1